MTRSEGEFERRYRWLLRCYPRAWRRRHEDEMVAVLMDQDQAQQGSTRTLGAVLDLVGHGLEERLESVLRWLPDRLRVQVATVAMVLAAGLALVMLGGEVIGARDRPPPEEIHHYGGFFISGPFMTIGVGLYLAFMSAALLVILGRGGVARLLILTAVGYAGWMYWPIGPGYPRPRLLVLALFAALGFLAALATVRASRRTSGWMLGLGLGVVAAVAVGLLLTQPFLGWSVAEMAGPGNVGFAAAASVLPVLTGLVLVASSLVSRRHPGWPTAITVTAVPVMVFCAIASHVVTPNRAGSVALDPLLVVLVAAVVIVGFHRSRARRMVSG
ncbi:hypothetical protein [uncultured Friedmanniella sp.]|uniref:hypothetical protein n=1 Tax=uncultured Friedmanniella sp. TaxID=335381 RepID=UPI0035CB998D